MNKQVISVALYGMGNRMKKTMTMFLQGPCRSIATVVDEIDAVIDIIDADAVESKEIIKDRKSKTPDRPIILLSLQSQSLEGMFDVKKPIKASELIAAIKKANLIASQNWPAENQVLATQVSKLEAEIPKSPKSIYESALEKEQKNAIDNSLSAVKEQQVEKKQDEERQIEKNQASESSVDSEEKKKTSKHSTANRLNEGSFSSYIGVAEGIDFSDIKQVLKASYSPRNYFLGYVQSAVNVAKSKAQILQLSSGWKPLIIFPKTHEVWLDAEEKQLRAFAGISIRNDSGKGMELSPVAQKTSSFNTKMERFFDIDAFIWKLAVWTSKGRYPDSIDICKPVFLKSWPNFTRLIITPHALRITAFLIEGPKTLMEISEALNIKPQYVFVFISASNAVGLIGQVEEKAVKTAASSRKAKKPKLKGLFGRILGRLRGKATGNK